ncbi:MAG: alpha/beta fold hydrolase [Anaerolineae bacterium]|nr:alpha/beta fold hydrolase [Anaerolineae bacterium]
MRLFPWRRFLILLGLGLVLAYLLLLGSLSFLYTYALLHPGCPAQGSPPEGFVAVRLTTADGLALDGWWKAPQNGAVILLMGGLGAGRDALLPEAALLAQHGYGALTLDSRACAGELSTLGQRETAEFDAMLNFALAQPGVTWVGALGFSVGGTAVINGAAARPEVRAVVAEGNFANLYEEFTAVKAPAYHPQWQVQRAVAFCYALLTGIWPGQVSPVDALTQVSPRPVLLVHGEEEIGRTQAHRQLAAAGPNARLWIVPGARHGGYRAADPQAYAERIVGFFDEARRPTVQPVLMR